MKTVKGIIRPGRTFDWKDYDYEVQLDEKGSGQVIELTGKRGAVVPETVDVRALEEMAIGNALLRDWCEREGWTISRPRDWGDSIWRRKNKCVQRISGATLQNAPQTMTEPVEICWFDGGSNVVGELLHFKGGINEWLSRGGDKDDPQPEEEKTD